MRKIALTFTVTTLVLGIFGAFFRWLQLMNAFDRETGLFVRGAGITAVLLVYLLLAAAAICLLTVFWLGRYGRSNGAETALRCATVAPMVIGWALGAVCAAAAFILMFSAGSARFPMLQRLFGAFGILAALSIPFLFGRAGGSGAAGLGRIAAVVITLFFCFWLIYDYKNVSYEPITWRFALEIPAIAVSTVAFYFVTRFYYGVGNVRNTLIALQLGVLLSVATIFDERAAGLNVFFIVAAAAQLLLEYLLIENLRETQDEP